MRQIIARALIYHARLGAVSLKRIKSERHLPEKLRNICMKNVQVKLICANELLLSQYLNYFLSRPFHIIVTFLYLEPCERAIYQVDVRSFDRLDFPFIKKINKIIAERYIIMYYSNEDVKIYTTSELVTFSSFISSIGGNLGLFVGFSFIGVVLFVCNLLEKLFA